MYQTIRLFSQSGQSLSPDQTTWPCVVFLELARPDSKNAINPKMIQETLDFFERLSAKPDVKILHLSGQGSTFCAGADIHWMGNAVVKNASEFLEYAQMLAQFFLSFYECPIPIVLKAHGKIRGGGVGLVALADIVVADEHADFALSEARIGLVPACIAPFVIRKMGHSVFQDLALKSRVFSVKHAYEFGLVHDIGSKEYLSHDILNELLAGSSNALKVVKGLSFDPHMKMKVFDAAKVLASVAQHSDAKEGMLAFLEKRKPKWAQSVSDIF